MSLCGHRQDRYIETNIRGPIETFIVVSKPFNDEKNQSPPNMRKNSKFEVTAAENNTLLLWHHCHMSPHCLSLLSNRLDTFCRGSFILS